MFMEIRDRVRDAKYFSEYLEQVTENIDFAQSHLRDSDGDEGKIRRLKRFTVINKFDLFYGKYSAGYNLEELKGIFVELLELMPGFWEEDSSIIQMFDMMSWAVLFEASPEQFRILDDLVRSVGRADALTEFYAAWMFEGKVEMGSDFSYGFPYTGLKPIVDHPETAAENLKKWLEKDWYKGHSEDYWYDRHKHPEYKTYAGYWSFEAGAVMKILGVDDSILKDTPYYPYDLVHYR